MRPWVSVRRSSTIPYDAHPRQLRGAPAHDDRGGCRWDTRWGAEPLAGGRAAVLARAAGARRPMSAVPIGPGEAGPRVPRSSKKATSRGEWEVRRSGADGP
jgi:hypothetical protein